MKMNFSALHCILLSLHNHFQSERKGYIQVVSSPKKSDFPLLLSSRDHSNESGFGTAHDVPFVSNEGRTANFMLFWPSISTFTLVRGWNYETETKNLQHAVNMVIKNNLVLTGTVSKQGIINDTKLVIAPGKFTPENHEFVNIIDLTIKVPDFKEMQKSEILAFMDTVISPIVPKAETVIESISNRSPLFGIDLVYLGDGYACYVVKMSHCVGDGVTYFKIMQQIDWYFNKKGPLKPNLLIDWSNEAIATHEIYPDKFSRIDAQIMYGLPFLLGLLKNTWNINKQMKGYFILSKEKILKKKSYYIDIYQGNVSSNDIITAALCEANLSTQIFAFTMNKRALHCNFGGNYHQEIPFAKNAVLSHPEKLADPRSFRCIVKKGWYYDTDEVPICPFVLGRVGRISSLASIQKLISKSEMEIICHAMLSSFVANVPMDTAFISSMDNETFVVLHNFREIKAGRLLSEIMI